MKLYEFVADVAAMAYECAEATDDHADASELTEYARNTAATLADLLPTEELHRIRNHYRQSVRIEDGPLAYRHGRALQHAYDVAIDLENYTPTPEEGS